MPQISPTVATFNFAKLKILPYDCCFSFLDSCLFLPASCLSEDQASILVTVQNLKENELSRLMLASHLSLDTFIRHQSKSSPWPRKWLSLVAAVLELLLFGLCRVQITKSTSSRQTHAWAVIRTLSSSMASMARKHRSTQALLS